MVYNYLMSELIALIILLIITGFAYAYAPASNSELERTKSTEDLTILYEGVKKYKSEIGTYPKKLEDLTVTKDDFPSNSIASILAFSVIISDCNFCACFIIA